MKFRTGFIAVALVFGSALATHAFTAQSADEMKKIMELVSPGEAHKLLADKIGKWDMKVKLTQPGIPAQESDATSEMKWILDGRFIEDHTTGSLADMPFTGRGFAGYDNMKKAYVSTWMDSMGTGIMMMEGTYDAATKTFTYTGEMQDPMQGKYVKTRSTEHMVDKDHMVMAMYTPGPDGKEMKMMEISYTRAK